MEEPGEEDVSQEEVRESQEEKATLEQLMEAKGEEVVAEVSEDVVEVAGVEEDSGLVEEVEAMANSDGQLHTMRMEKEEITKKMDNNNVVVVAAAEVVEEEVEVAQDEAETVAAIKTEEDQPIRGRTEEESIEFLENQSYSFLPFVTSKRKLFKARADFPTFSKGNYSKIV